MNYHELKKQETTGLLEVLNGSNGYEVGREDIGTVFVSKFHQPWDGPGREDCQTRSRVNALLLKHRWNNFDKALEALKAVQFNNGICQSETMRKVHRAIREMEEVK